MSKGYIKLGNMYLYSISTSYRRSQSNFLENIEFTVDKELALVFTKEEATSLTDILRSAMSVYLFTFEEKNTEGEDNE